MVALQNMSKAYSFEIKVPQEVIDGSELGKNCGLAKFFKA
jgi:hypothetical protein